MQKMQGVEKAGLANILKAKTSGYDSTSSGKINFTDGRMAIYTRNREDGSNYLAIDPHIEIDGGYSIEFSELPCDAAGNILLDSYLLNQFKRTTSTFIGQLDWQLTLICSKEPTHRLNVLTGEVIKDDGFNYLLDIDYDVINAEY